MRKTRILLIESDPAAAENATKILESRGYTVVASVGPGMKAIELALSLPFDLMIVNVMPGGNVDGIGAVMRIQERRNIPVIYTVSADDEKLLSNAGKTDYYGLLHKPFNDTELHHAVETALHLRQKHQGYKRDAQRYANLSKYFPVGLATVSLKDYTVQSANQYFAALLGYTSPGQVVGFVPGDFCSSDEGYERSLKAIMRGERTFSRDLKIKRKNGDTCRVEVSAWPVPDVDAVDCCFVDKSGFTRMGGNPQESEKLYRLVAENATDVIWIRNMDLQLTFVSPSVQRIQGTAHGDATTQNAERSLMSHSLARALEILDEELKAEKTGKAEPGRSRTFEVETLMEDGSTRWFEVNASFLRDDKGRPSGILGVDRDITRRKYVEKALLESEERYRRLVENINEVIYELDPDGIITYISPVIESRYKVRVDELTGRHYREFVHPDDLGIASRGHSSRQEDYAHPVEYRIRDGAGKVYHMRSSSKLLFDGGKVIGETGVLTDITEEKLAETVILIQRDLAVKLSTSVDLKDTLDAVLSAVLLLPGIEHGTVYVMNESSGMLDLQASRGRALSDITLPASVPVDRLGSAGAAGQASQVFISLLPARIRKRFQKTCGELLSTPVYYEGRIVAMILAVSGTGSVIPPKTVNGLGTIAAMTGDVLVRLRVERELRENEKFLSLVLDNMRDLVDIYNLTTKTYMYANACTRTFYGMEPWEYCKKPFGHYISANDMRRIRRILKEELLHDKERDPHRFVEFQLHETTGGDHPIWTELRSTFLRDDRGLPVSILSILRDITERKEGEQALRFRHEFDEMLARISTRFINLPLEKIHRGIDEAIKSIGKFAGVDRSYIYTMSDDGCFANNIHEWCADGVEAVRHRRQNVPVDEFPWCIETLSKFRDLYIPLVEELPARFKKEKAFLKSQGARSLLAVPMVSDKKFIGFLGFDSVRNDKTWTADMISLLRIVAEIFVNLMNRYNSERSLRIYKGIVSSSRDMICFVDVEHRVRAANREFLAILGGNREDVIGNHVEFFFGRDTYVTNLTDQLRHCRGGRKIGFELWHELPGKGERCLDLTLSPLGEKNTAVSGTIIHCRDITDRIQTEAKILGVIESERRKIGMELHDGLSHRLLGIAVQSKMLSEKLKEALPETAREASDIEDHINYCISNVRGLARGLNPFRHEHVSLGERIEEMCSMLTGKYRIKCSVDHDPEVQIPNINRAEQIYYIIHEALMNAVKHSYARNIKVTLNTCNDTITFSVKDDGRGMPQRDRRVKGMGLDIMRYRARMIGATLKIKSGQKSGTQIVCTLKK